LGTGSEWQACLFQARRRLEDDSSAGASSEDDKLWHPWKQFGCKQVFKKFRTRVSQSSWMMLRTTYQNIVGEEDSTIAPLSDENGFTVPTYVEVLRKKGRGVFTSVSVRAGDVVWRSRQTAEFSDADQWREFLETIPRDLACDSLLWAYVFDASEEGDSGFAVGIDLDEGSLVNHGRRGANVLCKNSTCTALRNIDVAEEIISDYGSFEVKGGAESMGFIP
jgi:hypothetical protein